MKMTHPLRLEKCNLESFLKAPTNKKNSFGFSLDIFRKLKVNWIDVNPFDALPQ